MGWSTISIQLFVLFLCLTCANAQKDAACANSKMSNTIRQDILTFHNDARRRVAKGLEPNRVGKLNSAKNMYKLEWDCSMEKQAQDAIAGCQSGLKSWDDMAQNTMTWSSSGGFSNPESQINTTLDSWWATAKQTGVTDKDNKYTNKGLYSFANMVFSETNKIGCAYSSCGNKLVFTCLYDKIGYYNNAPMWETGPACRQHSDCTTFPNSKCDDGLCIKGEPIPETSNQCSANSGMTDSVRQKFLELHNHYRSSLARGFEPDGLGGNAPKAAKMLKMVYNCSIEASAFRHAQKCVYQHSTNSERPGLGENLYMTTALKFEKIKAAEQSSQLWWGELKKYGVGQSNTLTNALWSRPNTQIGHYTQMAWETTNQLGCAVVHCPKFTYSVCQYGPTGNYINQMIYTKGEPCSGCRGSCNATEGLCYRV